MRDIVFGDTTDGVNQFETDLSMGSILHPAATPAFMPWGQFGDVCGRRCCVRGSSPRSQFPGGRCDHELFLDSHFLNKRLSADRIPMREVYKWRYGLRIGLIL